MSGDEYFKNEKMIDILFVIFNFNLKKIQCEDENHQGYNFFRV